MLIMFIRYTSQITKINTTEQGLLHNARDDVDAVGVRCCEHEGVCGGADGTGQSAGSAQEHLVRNGNITIFHLISHLLIT